MTVFDNIKLPKIIYETLSPYSGKIEIIEVGRTKKLIADGTVQSLNWDSPSTARRVWGRMIDVLKENEPTLHNVLVLGLGGGTMQRLISHHFPGTHIVSVEIDAVMIDIAKRFFNLDAIPDHKVINDDACRVLMEPTKFGLTEHTFDAVLVDIYCGDKFPELGKSGNFIAGVETMVRPGGLVVFNRIYVDDFQDEVNLFIQNLSNFLYDVKSLIIAGNTNSDNVLIFGRA